MDWQLHWGAWLACGLAFGGLAAYFYWRRRPTPQERERQRRAWLRQSGRLASGKIVDILTPIPAGDSKPSRRLLISMPEESIIAVYKYEIAGVEYESSQSITQAEAEYFLPGNTVVIRYDARNPGNCILTNSTRG